MIVGLGIDIVDIRRIEKSVSKKGFAEKVFSKHEIEFCRSQKNQAQHFAARFAAKEAFLKATGQGLALGYNLANIEVVSDSKGKPGILLKGNFKKEATKNSWNKIYLSLSHAGAMACAVVVIEE